MAHELVAIGLVLVCAKLLEGVATRLKLSSVGAYILVGIAFGALFEPGEAVQIFFSVGVFFLFFLIGIDEIDIPGFVETLRGRFFAAAGISFIVPFAANLTVFLLVMDLSTPNAIALSSLMALSSLGIVARVLADLGRLKEPIGLEIFTTVVMIEALGLLIAGFALEGGSHGGGSAQWRVALLLVEIVAFVAVAWVLSAKIMPFVLVYLRKLVGAPQLAAALMVGSLFLVVWGAEQIGMDGPLAALVYGMVNSGLPRRLRNDIMPSVRGLANAFFVPQFSLPQALTWTSPSSTYPPLPWPPSYRRWCWARPWGPWRGWSSPASPARWPWPPASWARASLR